jgi:PDZ domain-containing protein
VTLGISFMVTVLLLSGLAVLPSPYAVRSPGPTRDTLGQVDGTDLIEITGATTYESTGELRLTTVGVSGGPGYPVNLAQVVQGWLDPTRVVAPVETVFPPSVSREELDAQSSAEMTSSQEMATYAALTELGYDVPVTITAVETVEGSGARGVVEDGDVIASFDGDPLLSSEDLLDRLASTEPGSDVVLGIVRDGSPSDVTVTTTDPGDGSGGSRLGVVVQSSFDFPVDVSIQIENIGGPSAGTMFALGIIDRMTPEDEVNGQVIAGTGTMDLAGQVGPIGGIRQKLDGALRDGATWFLAPADNCEEVVGHVPDGLQVAKVSTLAEARAAMVAIGDGEGSTLPTCSSS